MSNPDFEPTDAPPSYSAATGATRGGTALSSSSTGESAAPPPSLDPAFFSTTLRTHLSDLPNRIRAASARNAHRQTASDLASISLLVPHVEAFLARAARRAAAAGPADPSRPAAAPLVGSLILVPASAVPKSANMGDLKERTLEGEYVRLVRVEAEGSFYGTEAKKKDQGTGGYGFGDAKEGGATSRLGGISSPRDPLVNEASGELRVWDPKRDECFDEWGRFGDDATPVRDEDEDEDEDEWCSDEERAERRLMWWTDEDTARRLASYLQPAAFPAGKLERKAVRRTVVDGKKEKRIFFGFGKGSKSKESAPKRAEDVVVADEAPPGEPDKENVTLHCSAREQSFQNPTEFGIYESLRGWGIVVDVKIRRI